MMSTYDKIRWESCRWCAKDRPFCDHVEQMHWTDHMASTVECTAPTKDEVIEQQAERIAALEMALAHYAKAENWITLRQNGPIELWDCTDADGWNGSDYARRALLKTAKISTDKS